jgi:hypothetical protein
MTENIITDTLKTKFIFVDLIYKNNNNPIIKNRLIKKIILILNGNSENFMTLLDSLPRKKSAGTSGSWRSLIFMLLRNWRTIKKPPPKRYPIHTLDVKKYRDIINIRSGIEFKISKRGWYTNCLK